MRKLLISGFAAVLIAGGGLYLTQTDTETANDPSASQDASNGVEEQKETDETGEYIHLVAIGDLLPHDTVNLRAKTGDDYDYQQFFKPIANYVSNADLVFCNQESPSAGERFGITGYPSFNAPIEFSRDLSSFGCNVINLANNHIADRGQGGINETLDVWEALNPLAISGANRSTGEQNAISYFTRGGKKFALISFTDLTNNTAISSFSVNMFSTQLVTSLATKAAANADYVIASAHWGVEDSATVSPAQKQWAELLAANGVDLIIGTGPHVIQPADRIGDTVVFYSLGNFLSTQLSIEELTGGIAFIDIPAKGEGEVKLSFLPTYMSYTWTASQAAAEDLLARDNLLVNPLDQSAELINNSLFDTTSAIQIKRIADLLNKNIEVEIVNSN